MPSKSPPTCSWFEGVTLVGVVMFIIGLFTIPTVLYFSNRSKDTQDWTSIGSALYSMIESCDTDHPGARLDNDTHLVSSVASVLCTTRG